MNAHAGNPYIAGSPLRDEYGFFGRRDVLDWVLAELLNANTNALVLHGQRRVGKTTILLQLQHHLPQDKFLPIYFDLQDQSKRRLGEVLGDLADIICSRINLAEHKLENFDNEGKYFRTTFLPELYKNLKEGCRPVFLFDEFDVLDQADEDLLDVSVASRALFPFLRQVMNEDNKPAFVFVVGRRTEDLRVDFNQMFKTSFTKEIWVLDHTSAETLVCQAETNGTLVFTKQAINRILQLTSNHAYLTQLVCQRLWQQAYINKPTKPPTIDVENVNSIISDTLDVGEQALIWLWNGLGPAEKIYTAALAELSNESKSISKDQVVEVLAEHAARLRRREVELAPQDLVTRHVLELTENREYLFAVELFRRWVKEKRSLRDVVDEIDRVDPIAQQLFQLGQDFHKKHEWKEAVRFFQEALQHNSSHFRANLLLGETYLSLGQLNEAVKQLETAYSLDRYESQYPLARALISYAKAKEKEENGDQEALNACERALEVSPGERLAQDAKKSIFEKQGDAAFKQGDLNSALLAYEKAENTEKIRQVREEYRKTKLESIESQAEIFVHQTTWKKAIPLYDELLENAPNQESKDKWLSALSKCKEEEKLEDLFTIGLGSLTRSDWDQSKRAFADVINIRPDYTKDNKSAAKLLEQAIAGRKPFTIDSIFQSNWFRISGSIALIIVIIGFLLRPSILFDLNTTNTPSITMSPITPSITMSPIVSLTPKFSPTITESLTSTPTLIPTPRAYEPILVFDNNLILPNINACWRTETQLNNLTVNDGFYRRTDKDWGFRITEDETTIPEERPVSIPIFVDFSPCMANPQITGIGINAWITKIVPERDSPTYAPHIVDPGREFGFFVQGTNGIKREYTLWIDAQKLLHLKVRENGTVIEDNRELVVSTIQTDGAFPRTYNKFFIQIFLELNNNGIDALYLLQGADKAVTADRLNPTSMLLKSILPTIGDLQKIGLVGYGGETQVLIWPLAFYGVGSYLVSTPTETPKPTETFLPTLQSKDIIGYGMITKFVYPVETPNGKRINHSLGPKQQVILLEMRTDLGISWYRCRWEENHITFEGWVLADTIQTVPAPTTTPTP